MDKLVYLYELDSVHNSPVEILRGQQALFEEIVINGNQVVLTFNQLTDSQAFLCAIRDPKSYPHMLELFRLGALKISRFAPPDSGESLDERKREQLRIRVKECRKSYASLFRDNVLKSYPPLPPDAPQRVLRTASHYIQNAIEKCLNDDNDSFLFSALPFRSCDKEILSALSYALQYSDPSVLDTVTFCFPGEDGPDEERQARERRDYVKRYVEMILQLSREPLAANPEKIGVRVSFGDMLERIQQVCTGAFPELGDETAQLLPQALDCLEILQKTAFGPGRPIHNRSNWHEELRRFGQEPAALLAEAVVDLCYNYTMEASISGVARHYWDDASFREDFLCRLRLYWEDGRKGIHQFQKGDLRALSLPTIDKMPPWDVAVRLLKSMPARMERTGDCGETVYESSDARKKREWYWRICRGLLKQLNAALIYLILFMGTSFMLDCMENSMSDIGAQFQFDGLFLSLFSIVLFGVAGSKLSQWLKLPDILDTIKSFPITMHDAACLLTAPRHVAYSRS